MPRIADLLEGHTRKEVLEIHRNRQVVVADMLRSIRQRRLAVHEAVYDISVASVFTAVIENYLLQDVQRGSERAEVRLPF